LICLGVKTGNCEFFLMCEADLDLERLVGGTSASSTERERRRFVATAGSASTSGKEQDWEGLGVEVAVKGGGSESVKKETVDLPEELADTGLRGSERDSVAIRRLGTLQRPRGLDSGEEKRRNIGEKPSRHQGINKERPKRPLFHHHFQTRRLRKSAPTLR
jgi:hypothetical protein